MFCLADIVHPRVLMRGHTRSYARPDCRAACPCSTGDGEMTKRKKIKLKSDANDIKVEQETREGRKERTKAKKLKERKQNMQHARKEWRTRNRKNTTKEK